MVTFSSICLESMHGTVCVIVTATNLSILYSIVVCDVAAFTTLTLAVHATLVCSNTACLVCCFTKPGVDALSVC